MTWREGITNEMAEHGETFADMEGSAGADSFDVEFDDGYGGTEGRPFTAWTGKRVYFPVCYDGAEWVGSVSRHPDGQATGHFGGG